MKATRIELGDSAIEITPQANGLVDLRLLGVNGLQLGVAVTSEQAGSIGAQLLVESIVAKSLTALDLATRVRGGQ